MKYEQVRVYKRAGDAVGKAYPDADEARLQAILNRVVETGVDQRVTDAIPVGNTLTEIRATTLIKTQSGKWLYLRTFGDAVPDLEALEAGRWPLEIVARLAQVQL